MTGVFQNKKSSKYIRLYIFFVDGSSIAVQTDYGESKDIREQIDSFAEDVTTWYVSRNVRYHTLRFDSGEYTLDRERIRNLYKVIIHG